MSAVYDFTVSGTIKQNKGSRQKVLFLMAGPLRGGGRGVKGRPLLEKKKKKIKFVALVKI